MTKDDYKKFSEVNGGEVWGPNGHILTVHTQKLMTDDSVRVMQCVLRALDIEFGDEA